MRVNGEKTAVVLDEQPLWLNAVGDLLARVGVGVIGTATNADEAVRLVEEHRPDMIIASTVPTNVNESLRCIERVKNASPSTKVIVLSASEDSDQIDAAFDAGASVYCMKTAEPEDLASAVRQAFHHSIFLARDRRAAGTLTSRQPTVPLENEPDLTRRELEILRLVADGHSNAQLARMLWVTEQTVKFHLSNIYRKLAVANRTEASRWAQLHGLLSGSAVESAA
jgi:DNA-binding NarL/FixJ family response regulator